MSAKSVSSASAGTGTSDSDAKSRSHRKGRSAEISTAFRAKERARLRRLHAVEKQTVRRSIMAVDRSTAKWHCRLSTVLRSKVYYSTQNGRLPTATGSAVHTPTPSPPPTQSCTQGTIPAWALRRRTERRLWIMDMFSFLPLLYIGYGQRPRIIAHTRTTTIDTTATSPLLHRLTTLPRTHLESTGAPVRLTAG